MHTSETIADKAEIAGLESSPSHLTGRGSTAATHIRSEALGRLHGATLTERVVGFLERYNRAAYGLR